MTINYLLKNRERPDLFSKRWFMVWAKRALTLPHLGTILFLTSRHRNRGIRMGHLAVLDGTKIRGRASNLSVGERTYVAADVILALHSEIVIGRCVAINSGVKLLTGSHAINDPHWPLLAQKITIEDYAWIAMNAIVLPGVTVGKAAVVGAGAVVRENVAPYTVVLGNPSRVVGARARIGFLYSPVDGIAAFEAWLGKVGQGKKESFVN